MPKSRNQRAEELANTINCARWLVKQFEDLDCPSIAKIFQRAVDDADTWIQTKALGGQLPKETATPIRAREANLIHSMLVKYASIDDPIARRDILQDMLSSVEAERDTHEKAGGKKYASRS